MRQALTVKQPESVVYRANAQLIGYEKNRTS